MMIQRRNSSPRPLSSALDHLLGTMRAPSVDVLSTVFGRWAEIVGPDLAKHCRPTAIDGDVVVIAVDDSAWAAELKWLRAEVIERLSEIADTTRITDIRVRVESRG